MEYEAFVTDYMKELKAEMGEGVELFRKEFPKVNGAREGISVVYKNSSVAPTIYLDDKYEAYERGQSISEITDMTVYSLNKRIEAIGEVPNMNEILNKDNLYCTLVNIDMNKDLLSSVPNRKVEDLAIIARCRVGYDGSFIVTNDMCSQLRMTSEEIIDQAKLNSMKEDFQCRSMTDVMRGMMEQEGIPQEFIDDIVRNEEECPMYILSNSSGVDGAVAMISGETLESARNLMGEDYYILPSSRHEVILVPESKVDDVDYLKEMVNQVNKTEVPKEDVLSNSVYKYDSIKKAFSTINEASMVVDKVSSKLEENMDLMTSTKSR